MDKPRKFELQDLKGPYLVNLYAYLFLIKRKKINLLSGTCVITETGPTRYHCYDKLLHKGIKKDLIVAFNGTNDYMEDTTLKSIIVHNDSSFKVRYESKGVFYTKDFTFDEIDTLIREIYLKDSS
ncbi:MAG: hypothetical protein GY804_09390 [Alphaproteobacteria bacterium]|nr:hypothetical protein [Alphaproteobacteria bacterium]